MIETRNQLWGRRKAVEECEIVGVWVKAVEDCQGITVVEVDAVTHLIVNAVLTSDTNVLRIALNSIALSMWSAVGKPEGTVTEGGPYLDNPTSLDCLCLSYSRSIVARLPVHTKPDSKTFRCLMTETISLDSPV